MNHAAQPLPSPGAVDQDGKVSFTLYAPENTAVHLIGDFNDWAHDADPMPQIAPGLWSITKDLPRGAFAYQFLVDQKTIICDPYARFIEEDPGDKPRKAIVKPRQDPYHWQHDRFTRPGFEDLLIYEMHIADFTPQRDFRETVERLDYIRELGMNAIELMPVFGVHENKGWGYTPTYLFAPNEDYGTPDELRWLIDEAHGKGIAVILDMVLAHTGHEHPFNQLYPYDQSPWYGQGPNGGNEYGLPQLDYAKQPTRDFVRDVLRYWLNEFHVDGFRFDYVKSIGVTEQGYGIPTLTWAVRQTSDSAYIIGEHLPENPELLLSAEMDGAWHVRFSYALKALLCQHDLHDFGPGAFEHTVRALDPNDQGYGQRPTAMINYLESHDEQRIMLALTQAGFDEESARQRSALGATILFTTVGTPMLYHGQTMGQDSPRNMDHNYIEWESLATPGGSGLHDHYKRLAQLRRQHHALRTPHFAIDAILPDQQSLVYHRWDDAGDEVVIAVNASRDPQTITVPLPSNGTWREFFTDQQAEHSDTLETTLQPASAAIYTKP